MNQKGICDIIIENITKDWYSSMSDNLKPTKWEIPKYSKRQVNHAGKIISDVALTFDDRRQVLDIINNWRASHAYPLQIITGNLRKNNPNAIVVQRLKRLDSIIGKLERFPDMELYRMQDLGGCRVIVDTIEQVYVSINKYKSSRIRHLLKREYDYIQNPKPSGYRSYHMVYQFQSDKKETYNKNMLIEVQFRTKLQHIWATAVEMMGIYTKYNLKSSQGDKEVLRFFTLVSSLFATIEHTTVCPNTSEWGDKIIKEILILDTKHQIMSKLSTLNRIAKTIENDLGGYNYKNGYYLLILDLHDHSLKIHSFKRSEAELATEAYNQLEAIHSSTQDVVLVSAKTFDTLQVAYPNYFTDIGDFIKRVKYAIEAYDEYME